MQIRWKRYLTFTKEKEMFASNYGVKKIYLKHLNLGM